MVPAHAFVNLLKYFSTFLRWTLSDGTWIWCLDGWVMQLMNENSRWDVSSITTQF
jgi:hypothetical protein